MSIKEVLKVAELAFSPHDIAGALFLSPDEVVSEFRDGRLTGRLAEIWGERLYGYHRHTNSNFAGSDGSIALGPIGRYSISVRAFRRSIKFQQSKFIGSGRQCSQEDLIRSLENVEMIIAVDIRAFPVVRFYPIDSKRLLKLVREGLLSPSGMSAIRFDEWISGNFAIQVIAQSVEEVAA